MRSAEGTDGLAGAPARPHSTVELREPVTLVMGAADLRGAVALSIPLAAFTPPLQPELWGDLAGARLPEPWGHRATVRCAVVGEGAEARLELSAEGVDARAWLQRPALVELRGRAGQSRLVALGAPAIAADFSAREAALTRDERFATQRELVAAKARLESLRAALEAPAKFFARAEQAALAETAEALERTRAEVRARRAQVVLELAVAPPATWAVAAEFPRPDAGPAAEAISALGEPLLELANAQGQAQRRALHLRRVIRALESDPALSGEAKAEATFEHRAALADLEPGLAQLTARLEALIDTLQQRARAAGLGDALLARGDFLLGQYEKTGVPGTFEHLLRAQSALEAELEVRRRLCAAREAVETAGAMRALRSVESKVVALEQRMTELAERLNWYARAPVRHPLATRY